jgi:hypothetical protein
VVFLFIHSEISNPQFSVVYFSIINIKTIFLQQNYYEENMINQSDQQNKNSTAMIRGIALGVALAGGIGVALGNLLLGLAIGIPVGIVLGISFRKKENRKN